MTVETNQRKIYSNGFCNYYYKCKCGSESVQQVNDGSFSPPDLICDGCNSTVTNTPIKVSIRELALEWWNKLLPEQQMEYAVDYPPRPFTSSSIGLTGREIEQIYHNEVIEPKPQEAWQESQVNQQQFKEFLNYMVKHNKFSIKDKCNAIAIGLLTIPISIDDMDIIVKILKKISEK